MKSYTKKKRRVKRSFQLLEILVSIFLLVLCAIPAIEIFTRLYKSQRQIVRENESDHLSHLIHAKLSEQLYANQISLQDLLQGKEMNFSDPSLDDTLSQMGYQVSYIFILHEPKTEKKLEEFTKFLFELQIKIKDQYSSTLTSAKNKSHPSSNLQERIYDYFTYVQYGSSKQSQAKEQEEIDEKISPQATDKASD